MYLGDASATLLEDLRPVMEAESVRLGHYYLGVEHLVLALLQQSESLLAAALQHLDCAPQRAVFFLRAELRHTLDRRYWLGFRETPRLAALLATWQQRALRQPSLPSEHTLLLEMLKEPEATPWRVLRLLDISIADLQAALKHLAAPSEATSTSSAEPTCALQSLLPLSQADQDVIQRAFASRQQVEMKKATEDWLAEWRLLYGEVSPALENDLPGWIAFGAADWLLTWEWMDKSLTTPAPLQALWSPVFLAQDHSVGLRHLANWPTKRQSNLLEALQVQVAQAQPFSYPVWQAAEWLLPSVFSLKATALQGPPQVSLFPLENWADMVFAPIGQSIAVNDLVVVAQSPAQQAYQLSAAFPAAGAGGASSVWVVEDPDWHNRFPGLPVRYVEGELIDTRQAKLLRVAAALAPDFDPASPQFEVEGVLLHNPFALVADMLTWQIRGSRASGFPALDYVRVQNVELDLGCFLMTSPYPDIWWELANLEITALMGAIPRLAGTTATWPALWAALLEHDLDFEKWGIYGLGDMLRGLYGAAEATGGLANRLLRLTLLSLHYLTKQQLDMQRGRWLFALAAVALTRYLDAQAHT
ncbi:MAG: hypothetical protein HC915_01760 [Anaerolineae bacterium]|nr:hypothetical protein [Anaerolineae bacterium]